MERQVGFWELAIKRWRQVNRDQTSLDCEVRGYLLNMQGETRSYRRKGRGRLYRQSTDWVAPEHIRDLDWIQLQQNRVATNKAKP